VNAPSRGEVVIAVDPGREKCGVAVVDESGELLDKFVVATASLVGALKHCLEEYETCRLVVGDGTGSRDVQTAIAEALPALSLHIVSEEHTSERGLELWRDVQPPRGWRRLLPRSFRFPVRPIDDFAAWILAQDYLGEHGPKMADSAH
jgi:hypothetical protein